MTLVTSILKTMLVVVVVIMFLISLGNAAPVCQGKCEDIPDCNNFCKRIGGYRGGKYEGKTPSRSPTDLPTTIGFSFIDLLPELAMGEGNKALFGISKSLSYTSSSSPISKGKNHGRAATAAVKAAREGGNGQHPGQQQWQHRAGVPGSSTGQHRATTLSNSGSIGQEHRAAAPRMCIRQQHRAKVTCERGNRKQQRAKNKQSAHQF
ncbi:hypothetical protein FRX31_004130 [Thalictrum thalictroides]|uniref:Uncharacterized protein n=1 Tax=Thalictrum thalictroides TaxID=46969 RepID=A0A7J6XA01_THATH|nr:hypothetical protein FRX31_004130 [Thalictrum thalictroides]